MTPKYLTMEDFFAAMAKEQENREQERLAREQERLAREQERLAREQERLVREQEWEKEKQERLKRAEEHEKQFKELHRLFKETNKGMEGVKKSLGEEAEEFFASSLTKHPFLGNIRFDFVTRSQYKEKNEKKQQIDILLENGNAVGVVEVKNKVRMDDLEQLDRIIEEFYEFYPKFRDMKLYGAIAGKIVPENIEKKALKKGYFVLKQVGKHMEITPPQ